MKAGLIHLPPPSCETFGYLAMDSLHLLDGQAVNPPSANGADLDASLLALGKRARKASRVLALASPEQKNCALLAAAEFLRARTGDLSAPTPRTWSRRAQKISRRRRWTGCRSMRLASPAWRKALRTSPPCPIRSGACSRLFAPQWPAHRTRRHAARRGRRDLRESAQRHRRRGRPVPQGRQRRDSARGIGKLSFLAADPCLPGRGFARRRAARRLHRA